jgi:Flp pilus assembly protein TadD
VKTASPELLRGRVADTASDLYSFGAVLFEVLSGKPPFAADWTAPAPLSRRVRSAMSAWPDGTLGRLRALAAANPQSGFVRLNLGIALYWAGRQAGAATAWRAAKRVDPDTPSAVRAASLLHPEMARGLPTFVPGFNPPARLAGLAGDRQLAALARAARAPDVHAKLLYGVALQRIGRPLSAERQFAAAAALAPDDPEARVAAAVGLFDKDDPARAFSRLGPLVERFPRAPTVRFHLGLLLLWIGRVQKAKEELRLARAEGPRTPLGREADRFLVRLASVHVGTR